MTTKPSTTALAWPTEGILAGWAYLFLICHPAKTSWFYLSSCAVIFLLGIFLMLYAIGIMLAKEVDAKPKSSLPLFVGLLLLWQNYILLGGFILIVTILSRSMTIARTLRPKAPTNIIPMPGTDTIHT